MNRDHIDGVDDVRELRRLLAELMHTAPGAARLASATPDFGSAFKEMGRVSHAARVVASDCADLIVGALWATSATVRLARAVSRSTRR
jgi:hypothetical protein